MEVDEKFREIVSSNDEATILRDRLIEVSRAVLLGKQ
jgi:hypothetical protein